MSKGILLGLLVIVAVAVLGSTAYAADKDGIVVSVAEGKLIMSDKDGKNEQTHAIAATTKISLDGKAAKLADLKKGDGVKVTVGADGQVSAVAATRAKAPG